MNETYIEITGNIIVHHPVKVETTKYPPLNVSWDDLLAAAEARTMTEAELRRVIFGLPSKAS